MKTIIVQVLVLFSCALAAQTAPQNMQVKNGLVAWQHVYEKPCDGAAVLKAMKIDGRFEEVELVDSTTIVAKLVGYELDYKKQGYTKLNTPMCFSLQTMDAYIVINLKNDKYRVTVNAVKFTQKEDISMYNKGDVTALEAYVLRKDKTFRNSFKKATTMMDVEFLGLFDFELGGGEW